jgi:hypothetical protein
LAKESIEWLRERVKDIDWTTVAASAADKHDPVRRACAMRRAIDESHRTTLRMYMFGDLVSVDGPPRVELVRAAASSNVPIAVLPYPDTLRSTINVARIKATLKAMGIKEEQFYVFLTDSEHARKSLRELDEPTIHVTDKVESAPRGNKRGAPDKRHDTVLLVFEPGDDGVISLAKPTRVEWGGSVSKAHVTLRTRAKHYPKESDIESVLRVSATTKLYPTDPQSRDPFILAITRRDDVPISTRVSYFSWVTFTRNCKYVSEHHTLEASKLKRLTEAVELINKVIDRYGGKRIEILSAKHGAKKTKWYIPVNYGDTRWAVVYAGTTDSLSYQDSEMLTLAYRVLDGNAPFERPIKDAILFNLLKKEYEQ